MEGGALKTARRLISQDCAMPRPEVRRVGCPGLGITGYYRKANREGKQPKAIEITSSGPTAATEPIRLSAVATRPM